ncbi:MAG: hypothetical protein U0641_12600 [Anaerolineae bacterium]
MSERTLHGLLGLGVFLILASGLVISFFNPTHLPPLFHVFVVAATNVLFYAVGFFTRQRLRLVLAGTALLGVGAVFTFLTFTVGGTTLLGWELATAWMVASWLCLPIYAGTYALIRERTFGLLTAIMGESALMATLYRTGAPIEWSLAALIALGMGYIALSYRLSQKQPPLAWSLLITAITTATAVICALTAADSVAITADLLKVTPAVSAVSGYAVATAWWLGVGFYALLARLSRLRIYALVAAWAAPVAMLFTLVMTPVPVAWYSLCLAVLAAVYLVVGRYVQRLLADAQTRDLRHVLAQPTYQVALALPVFASLWPVAEADSRAATLTVVALTYALAAWLFRWPVFAWVAVLLTPLAYAFWLSARTWPPTAFTLALVAAAAVYLALAEVEVRRAGEARRPLIHLRKDLGPPRSLFARPLFVAGYSLSVLGLALALVQYAAVPAHDGVRLLTPMLTAAMLGIVAIYSVSAFTRRTSLFLYPATWLFLLPAIALCGSAFAAAGLPFPIYELARCLAVLAVGYLAVAFVTDRAGGHYSKPIYLAGYILTLAAMPLSALNRAVNVQVVGLVLLVFATSAWLVYRGRHTAYLWVTNRLFGGPASAASRVAQAGFLYLVAFIFAPWLLLFLSMVLPPAPLAMAGVVLTLLAPAYIAVGLFFRRSRAEYPMPWYIAGYALSVVGPLVAWADPTWHFVTLAVTISLYAASARIFRQSGWLYPVAGLTAVLFWQALGRNDMPTTYKPLAMLGLAGVYLLAGVILHHRRLTFSAISGVINRYALPFFLGAYVIGALALALVVFQDKAIIVVGYLLGAAFYAASAVLFRQRVFAYPTAAALAVAYVVAMTMTPLSPNAYGPALLPDIAAFLVAAEVLRRRLDGSAPLVSGLKTSGSINVRAWSMPFYITVYLGTIAAPILAGTDPAMAALTWGGIAAVYAASAVLFRQSLFAYPTAASLAAAYVFAMTMTPLSPSAYGPVLLPGIAAFLVAAEVLRRRLDHSAPLVSGLKTWDSINLRAWSMPFYVAVYLGTIAAPILAGTDPALAAPTWWGIAAIYGVSVFLFRAPLWLYPTILSALVGYVAAGRILWPTSTTAFIAAALVAPTWLLIWLAYGTRRIRRQSPAPAAASGAGAARLVGIEPLLRNRWAAPPLATGVATLVLSAAGAATDAAMGLWVFGAYFVLLVAFTFLYSGRIEAWASLILAALAFEEALRVFDVSLPNQAPLWAAAGLAISLLAILARRVQRAALAVWRQPLFLGSIMAGAAAMMLAVMAYSLTRQPESLQALAITSSVVGLALIAHAIDRHQWRLGYLGGALINLGYVFELAFLGIDQVQAYVLPTGLYMLGMAYLEWRHGGSHRLKVGLETAALLLLLVTSLAQSVGFLGLDIDSHLYATFFLLEAVALLSVGVIFHWKRSFLAGTLAIVVDIVVLLDDPVRATNTWYLVGIIGLLMIAIVLFIERQRQRLLTTVRDWRHRLETWD